MKEVKIKKSWLKNPAILLKNVGAVSGTQAFPSDVFISKEDYKAMRKELTLLGKKQGLVGRRLEMAVGMELLGLGPNESLGSAVRPGFVLVDEASIADQIKARAE